MYDQHLRPKDLPR